jgi:hypothetical protein
MLFAPPLNRNMFYLAYTFFTLLSFIIVLIFYFSIAKYRSWPAIKEHWFRVGIDNRLIFSSKTLDNKEEVAQLDGEYNGYLIKIYTVKSKQPHSCIEVFYNERLNKILHTQPQELLEAMNLLLSKPPDLLNEEVEDTKICISDSSGKTLYKKINPSITTLLTGLSQQYEKIEGVFEFDVNRLKFQQPKLLFDPNPLFPILDEMVVTIEFVDEHSNYLLVK